LHLPCQIAVSLLCFRLTPRHHIGPTARILSGEYPPRKAARVTSPNVHFDETAALRHTRETSVITCFFRRSAIENRCLRDNTIDFQDAPRTGKLGPMSETSKQPSDGQRWDPALYESRASFVSGAAADLVDLLAPVAGESILDLGCGPGELTAVILARGCRVVGVDASAEMISRARERLPQAELIVADGQALSFDQSFDAVFSNAALHWMRRADDTARGIFRALRPGGRLVAEFGGAGCIVTVSDAVAATLTLLGEDATRGFPWYFPSLAGYAAVLQSAGLEPRFAHLFPRPTRVAGADGLASWLQLFLAPLADHLGARWPDFQRAVEDRCRPRLFDGTDWLLDYVRLRVVARRPLR
jgi:trans-aconitate methyltransferase